MVNEVIKIQIQKAINKCFNLITITHQPPTIENFSKEGLLTLNQLINLENQKLGYKLYNGMLPNNIQKALGTESTNKDLHKHHNYNTRHKLKLYFPVANNKLYHNSFLTQALKVYDKLPKEITLCTNIKIFISKCKARLLQRS